MSPERLATPPDGLADSRPPVANEVRPEDPTIRATTERAKSPSMCSRWSKKFRSTTSLTTTTTTTISNQTRQCETRCCRTLAACVSPIGFVKPYQEEDSRLGQCSCMTPDPATATPPVIDRNRHPEHDEREQD